MLTTIHDRYRPNGRARWLVVSSLSLLAALWVASDMPAAAPCQGSTERTVFGAWRAVDPQDQELSAATPRQQIGPHADARYVRALIELRDRADDTWHINVRDEARHILQTLGPLNFVDRGEVLTARHSAKELVFELNVKPGTTPAFTLRQIILMPNSVSGTPYYSRKVDGVDDWQDLHGVAVNRHMRPLGDNVAFLMVGVQEGREPSACSGIALPPHYVLTNWHCGLVHNASGEEVRTAFWRQSICERTLIDLSWDDDQVSREFLCETVLAKSETYDYALLKIRPLGESSAIGPVTIKPESPVTNIALVHHPAAAQKKISVDCNVIDRLRPSWRNAVPDVTFTHDCDTEHGSSGAPVFDNSGRLIGLHHRGHELDANGQCDRKNKAIWINRILVDLALQASQRDDDPTIKLTPQDVNIIRALVEP